MSLQREYSDSPLPRKIAVLGASGSVGASALDVIAFSQGRLHAEILSVHSDTEKLVQLAEHFRPQTVVVTNEQADRTPLKSLPAGTELLFGNDNLNRVVQRPEIDVVLSAIVGSAGLASTRSALEANKTVALANKESMVVGGPYLMDILQQKRGRIIPVDSEHCAIYQCLLARDLQRENTAPISILSLADELVRLILTASGGPFRTWTKDQLSRVTPRDALAHPTWTMGKKVTIDSATMMNKALEIVEARWLFGVEPSQMTVMIHPQSIIHSMVEFVDGTVMAQMSQPDMRLPIQLALDDRQRFPSPARKMDWSVPFTLELLPPDEERFPAIRLGLETAKAGGTAGAVVNAANETAVRAFLEGRLTFDKIVPACQAVLDYHHYEANPIFSRLLELEGWARKETEKWILL